MTDSRPRTRDGFVIDGENYILPRQARARRWCFGGIMVGAPTFLVIVFYVASQYGKPRGIAGLPRARFGSWELMPSEVQVLLLVAIAAWAVCFSCMLMLVLIRLSVSQQFVEELH